MQNINKEQVERLSGEIKIRSERYENDYQALKQEKQGLKEEMEVLKNRLGQEELMKNGIQKQLEDLSQRASRDVHKLSSEN